MDKHLIGIAQMRLSKNPTDILIAPNLGSCLGISVYDTINKYGGMVHCLLPFSKTDTAKAAQNPCMYVDTGLALLLQELLKSGVDKKHLEIVAVGGANINDNNNIFEIGKKNCIVLKKILWKNGLLLKAEHLGESVSRTIALEIATGRTCLKIQGEEIEL